jgi:tRNA threonylcarbamoyladenosine biosynthesis protein TsaE
VTELQLTLADEAATVALGGTLAQAFTGGGVIYLQGNLGAGKTTLSRGLLTALGHSGAVKSPTYTLVEPYEIAGRKLYHFDLYRLGDAEELEYMGIRDYFTEHNLCLIEWPERGEGFLPAADLIVKVSPVQIGAMIGREAKLQANSLLGHSVLERIAA